MENAPKSYRPARQFLAWCGSWCCYGIFLPWCSTFLMRYLIEKRYQCKPEVLSYLLSLTYVIDLVLNMLHFLIQWIFRQAQQLDKCEWQVSLDSTLNRNFNFKLYTWYLKKHYNIQFVEWVLLNEYALHTE